MPLLAVFYAVMLRSWTRAVDDLAEHYDPSHAHRMSVAGSLDEDDVAGVLPPVAVGGGPDGDDYGGAAASGCRRARADTHTRILSACTACTTQHTAACTLQLPRRACLPDTCTSIFFPAAGGPLAC